MSKKPVFYRLISWMLAAVLAIGPGIPAGAAAPKTPEVTAVPSDQTRISPELLQEAEPPEAEVPVYADSDPVRVSVFLDGESTIGAGFSVRNLAENMSAMSYRSRLEQQQARITADIERKLGHSLDVCWNLTLAANVISANVLWGQLDTIRQVPGVARVVPETRYDPQTVEASEPARPNMMISTGMTRTQGAWEAGFTGAGTRIAVIDTGLDVLHRSVDSGAFGYALDENARALDRDPRAYRDGLHLLTQEEIGEKLKYLNVSRRQESAAQCPSPEQLYVSEKIPFGFNYLDNDLNLGHEKDTMSAHGSHVTGIAAANRFLPGENGFVPAEDVGMVGNAPDAQVLVMKVFGKKGGAYESDYLAAMEDAIVLGCDAINLSLGTASPGFSLSLDSYAKVLDAMVESDSVVSVSMGNSGQWAEHTQNSAKLPYVDHINFYTGGSPGSFPNPMTAASVENSGTVGPGFEAAGKRFTYTETGTRNRKLSALDDSPDGSGVELDYVFLESKGYSADYAGIDVADKVVFVSRGGPGFTDKGNVLAAKGAAAGIIYNNVSGNLKMDLSGFRQDLPLVSISMDAARWIREHSQSMVTETGTPYHTGRIHIDHKIAPGEYGSSSYVMSSFSSWGVPGNLTLKPEITAPGGGIYSIGGSYADNNGNLNADTHDQYLLMSGTSMAAPQVTGIAALVLQSIRSRGLSHPDMNSRALAQSLLMSTAKPMQDAQGRYYPVIQQGAGLADAQAAVQADSCISVDGQPDGKIKAELGDDPGRTGEYGFRFTLANLEDRAQEYTLSADLFTQEPVQGYANAKYPSLGRADFLGLSTVPLPADLTWTADGRTVSSVRDLARYDYSGDGTTDLQDAEILMNLAMGIPEEVEGNYILDIHPDGTVNTYDVYCLLKLLGTEKITVPARGSVEISVTARLTQAQKEQLDRKYPGGTFVEGYVFADPVRAEDTAHSIPLLGYYGSWTDSSMFDVGSQQEYATDSESRQNYTGLKNNNTYTIVYHDKPDKQYYFGGNPVMRDPVYLPERNAINSLNGDRIFEVVATPIRNAVKSRFLVEQDGAAVHTDPMDPVPGTYYDPYRWDWIGKEVTQRIQWKPKNLTEGTRLELKYQMAPEFYRNPDGKIRWEELADGASMTCPLIIDNTAPSLGSVSLDPVTGDLNVQACDNQYVAAVVLSNSAGTRTLDRAGALTDAVPGEMYTYSLDRKDSADTELLVQITDYAMNTTAYRVQLPETAALQALTPAAQEPEPQPEEPEFYTLHLTADTEMTNGKLDISYDTRMLEPVSWEGNGDLHQFVPRNGRLVFGFASREPVAAGTELATVTFSGKKKGDTEISVTLVENGPEKPGTTERTAVHFCASEKFTDVDREEWYHESIDFVLNSGLMIGVSENRFDPEGTTTRGQLITILHRLAGCPDASGKLPFVDVPRNEYYADPIRWGVAEGIVMGVTPDRFAPEQEVTREQMVAFLARYCESLGMTVSGGSLEQFPDARRVEPYARRPLAWAVDNGIIVGIAGRLEPKEEAARAQIAAVIYRFTKLLN